MPTSQELIEISRSANERMEQQYADLFPQANARLCPYTVEGELLAASDLPTQYNLAAVKGSPFTPLPAVYTPEAAISPPFTLPARLATPPIPATEEPSPPVALAISQAPFTYKHHNIRSSLEEQIAAGVKDYNMVPEQAYVSNYCRLILDMLSWGGIYYYEGYEIALLAGNWLADDEVALYGNQGPLPQPKTAPLPEQLPAWLEGLEKREGATCGGIGGDGGDQGVLPLAS